MKKLIKKLEAIKKFGITAVKQSLEDEGASFKDIIIMRKITKAINVDLNVKIIDLVDENYKNWYQRYTSYIKNYNFVYRNKFSEIKDEMLNKI